MFRWLLIAIAALGLMIGIENGRILLNMRPDTPPTVLHWLGLLISLVFTLGAMLVIGFLDYKAEKQKGNVVRTIALFEKALAASADFRAQQAAADQESKE